MPPVFAALITFCIFGKNAIIPIARDVNKIETCQHAETNDICNMAIHVLQQFLDDAKNDPIISDQIFSGFQKCDDL